MAPSNSPDDAAGGAAGTSPPPPDWTEPAAIFAQARQVLDEARDYFAAEIRYGRLLVGVNARAVKSLAIWLGVALIFFTGALLVLIIGSLLIAVHFLGPIVGSAVILVAALLICALAAWLALRIAKRLPITGRKP